MVKTNQVVSNVGDLMTGDLITLRPSDPVHRAQELLVGAGLHALPVLDERGDAIGMVTSVEVGSEVLINEPVASVMVQPVVTIDVNASIAQAANLMRAEFIHHLVVTDGTDTVGILSTYDLLYVLSDE